MKEDYHVDMSGRLYEKKTIGIALVSTNTKTNYGCSINRRLLSEVKKNLFKENIYKDSAKLYAICIYLLIKDLKKDIRTLIICNDEDFTIVKKTLIFLLKDYNFEIINISEFRKRLGRNIGSLADNYARIYRKRALNPYKQSIGKKINVVHINFKIIKELWEEIIL